MRVSRCNSTLKEINAARVYEDSPPGCPQPIYPALGWARGMAEEKPVVLYPAYFDLKRSREEGRRVPKALAVDGPTTEEIEKAAKALGLVLVRADYFKTSIVRKVAERIKAARQA